MFPHPWNPAGYLPVDILPRPYKSVIDSAIHLPALSRLPYPVEPVDRALFWERTLRARLISQSGAFLRGRPRTDAGQTGLDAARGPHLDAAKAIKNAVKIPVLCTGAFQRARASKVRSSAKSATPSLFARPLLANPGLPNELTRCPSQTATRTTPKAPCSAVQSLPARRA